MPPTNLAPDNRGSQHPASMARRWWSQAGKSPSRPPPAPSPEALTAGSLYPTVVSLTLSSLRTRAVIPSSASRKASTYGRCGRRPLPGCGWPIARPSTTSSSSERADSAVGYSLSSCRLRSLGARRNPCELPVSAHPVGPNVGLLAHTLEHSGEIHSIHLLPPGADDAKRRCADHYNGLLHGR